MNNYPNEYLILYKLISPSYTVTDDDVSFLETPLFANLDLSSDY